MGTRSNIILWHEAQETYSSVYCHWDGYPSGVGKTLQENYNTYSKVRALIQLGSLSELAPTLDECISYHRWRGEPLRITNGADLNDHVSQDYAYLFRGGQWFYCRGDLNWRPLDAAAIAAD